MCASLRWRRPTKSRDQLLYIILIRQFYGMPNSQSAEAILVELERLLPVTICLSQYTSVPSLNFHYTTFCRPGGGRDPGAGLDIGLRRYDE